LLREQDYNLFLLNELNELPENINALTDLESEYEKLSNAEKIQSSLSEAVQLSNQDEIGVRDLLNKVKSLLANVVQYSESFESLYNRVESVAIEFDDIITSIEDESQDLDIEPRRLQELTELINKLQSLYLKHNVNNIDELLEVKDSLSDKSMLFDSIDENIDEIEKNISNLESSLNRLSEDLDKGRKQIIPTLIKELKQSISDLGISNADFEIRLNPNQEFNKFGKTTIEFLFSANKGQSLKSLKNSASGGELSRIMLSIKAIMARYSKLPTLIFDEIDTGVSGDVATKVADIMHTMSSNMQLLSISHLPQIAAKGHAHLKVFKMEENEKTITKLTALNPEERVVEIAEMLSGKQKTTTAIEHAKQLLN
ncbi:MAG: DNA repair protein RecN, partial [bacterium]